MENEKTLPVKLLWQASILWAATYIGFVCLLAPVIVTVTALVYGRAYRVFELLGVIPFGIGLFAGPIVARALRAKRAIPILSRATMVAGFFGFIWSAVWMATLMTGLSGRVHPNLNDSLMATLGSGVVGFVVPFVPGGRDT